MSRWWTETWSVGLGTDRLYCGIARTEEGFAVDVFHRDTCIDSVVCATRKDALKTAAAMERRYTHAPRVAVRVDSHERAGLVAP